MNRLLTVTLVAGMFAPVAMAAGQANTFDSASLSDIAVATAAPTTSDNSRSESAAQAEPATALKPQASAAPQVNASEPGRFELPRLTWEPTVNAPEQGRFGLESPSRAATGTQFPHIGTCCNPGAGPVTGGALFEKIFSRRLADRGFYVENFLQIGLAENTASDPTGRAWEAATIPWLGFPIRILFLIAFHL